MASGKGRAEAFSAAARSQPPDRVARPEGSWSFALPGWSSKCAPGPGAALQSSHVLKKYSRGQLLQQPTLRHHLLIGAVHAGPFRPSHGLIDP